MIVGIILDASAQQMQDFENPLAKPTERGVKNNVYHKKK